VSKLSVTPGGQPQSLGISVPSGDNVSVHISGLPRYETITADGKTFRGASVTLTTAAEANSAVLSSSYRGRGTPTAMLTVTATDTTTGLTSAGTITVNDPPAAPTTPSSTSTTTSGGGTSWGRSRIDVSQWFNNHPDFARVATTLSEAGASRSGAVHNVATTTADPIAGTGARSYALLNQMMAGDFGRDSHFAQTATAALSAMSQQQPNLLTRALH
jgi:hypothetical protein